MGDRIRITAELFDVESGNNIGAGQVEGTKVEDIFEMTDRLTEEVAGMLQVSASGQELKIADVTTSSFEAYKFYQKGMEHALRIETSRAVEDFERALEIDPTFAEAHLGLANSRGWYRIRQPFSDLSPIRESISLAQKYSRKATDLVRRTINTYYFIANRSFEEANRQAVELADLYPEESWLAASTWRLLGQAERGIPYIEREIKIDPTFAPSYNSLAYYSSVSNDHQKAISAVKKLLALEPDVRDRYHSAWEIYMSAGHYDEAYDAAEEALSRGWYGYHPEAALIDLLRGRKDKARERIRQMGVSDPDRAARVPGHLGYFSVYEGKYREAISHFEESVELANQENDVTRRMRVLIDLAKILVIRGEYSEALKRLTEVNEISVENYNPTYNPVPLMTDYLAGLAMVQKGDLAEAQSKADSIERFVVERNYESFFLDFYNMLKAAIRLAEEEGPEAAALLDDVSGLTEYYCPQYQILLGAAQTLLGDHQAAVNTYQNLCNDVMTYHYPYGGDHFDYFLGCSRANFWLGEVYEAGGDKTRAIEYTQKALEQWKDADEGFPELLEARERLARLSQNP
jgi:tetratricopeptide (TPR) repeat protein